MNGEYKIGCEAICDFSIEKCIMVQNQFATDGLIYFFLNFFWIYMEL